MPRYVCTVGPKGQITLPIEARRKLGIAPSDKVAVEIEGDKITVRRTISSVLELAGSIPALKNPLTPRQVRDIALDEMAQEAARKGLD